MGNAITHVANASGTPIRVYYSMDEMPLKELVEEHRISVQSSVTKLIFKADTCINYMRVPENDYGKLAEKGPIYVSVFLESGSCCDECSKTIVENECIPTDRSFIITKTHQFKWQKYGGDIWEDEDGIRHDY